MIEIPVNDVTVMDAIRQADRVHDRGVHNTTLEHVKGSCARLESRSDLALAYGTRARTIGLLKGTFGSQDRLKVSGVTQSLASELSSEFQTLSWHLIAESRSRTTRQTGNLSVA